MTLADNLRRKMMSLPTQLQHCFRIYINGKKITLVCKQTTITMEVNIITIVILEACIQRKPYTGNIIALKTYIAHASSSTGKCNKTNPHTKYNAPNTQFKLPILLGHKFKIGHANFKTKNGSNENKMIQYD